MSVSFVDKVLAKIVQDQPTLNPEIADRLSKSINDAVENLQSAAQTSSTSVIMKLLGFKPSYGSWEIDHCNNRSGNSPIGELLMPILKEEAVKTVQTIVDGMDFAKDVDKNHVASLIERTRSAYRMKFYASIQEQIKNVEVLAQRDAAEMFPHIVQHLFGKTIEEMRVDIIVQSLSGSVSNEDAITDEVLHSEETSQAIYKILKK